MRDTSHRRLGTLLTVWGLALALVGCGSSQGGNSSGTDGAGGRASSSTNGGATAPGVTATSITFGTHQPLTGPAAPGYSEIAPASQAYFDFVNAHGGVFGRSIHLTIKDDAYNPSQTVSVVRQLVLQNSVFGIVEGLGTPTHTKVVSFLNADKVPDLFVGSGCPCWENGSSEPYTFGWQPNYTIEGKILGEYIKRHFAGQKVAVLYQDDDFGQGGLAGIRDELPASRIVTTQPYQSGVTSLTSQITALKGSGATVLVSFTVPIYTAIAELTSFTLGYHPQLVVANVGIDPTTVAGLLKTVSKGRASGTALIEGAITDAYLPPPTDTSNPWIRLFMNIRRRYDSSAPFDVNVEYGMANAYTVVQALEAAGPHVTRQGLVLAIERRGASWRGPGFAPYRYSARDHGGLGGARIARVKGGKIVAFGDALLSDPSAAGAITPYSGGQASPPASGIPSP